MSDIKQRAERFRAAKELGADKVYDGDTELSRSDAYVLAREHMKLLDQTPLNELSVEQWKELGFEWEECPAYRCWVRMTGPVFISFVDAGDDYEVAIDGIPTGITTLGQLRHLKAALGGEQ